MNKEKYISRPEAHRDLEMTNIKKHNGMAASPVGGLR
jgi:hypothetical protein